MQRQSEKNELKKHPAGLVFILAICVRVLTIPLVQTAHATLGG